MTQADLRPGRGQRRANGVIEQGLAGREGPWMATRSRVVAPVRAAPRAPRWEDRGAAGCAASRRTPRWARPTAPSRSRPMWPCVRRRAGGERVWPTQL